MSGEIDILGKIEDAGLVVHGGGIDRYWNREGIEHEVGVFFDKLPQHTWLFDSNKALEHFNLRSIEFGNWMNQEDRANFLYASMLSLHHLAKVLGVEDAQIGFNKKLSIALGARGKGAAAGHYEPNPYSVINVTKTQGVGVLAHEYAHAIDNILSFHLKSEQSFVSGGRTTRKGFNETIFKNGNWFEKQFEQLFNVLFFDKNGNKTELHEQLDEKDDYWNRRNEVFARTFEVYISQKFKNKRIKDTFAVHPNYDRLYPDVKLTKQVTPIINNIISKSFKVINEASTLNGIEVGISGYMGFRKTLKLDADLDSTLENMQRIAWRDFQQVKQLAEALECDSVEATSENIWNWLRENTRYKLDTQGIEELRTPARSIMDGTKGLSDDAYGIDCDDYTILISAMLIGLGINHEYRVVAYKDKGKFQHIYPVAFNEWGDEFIIDAVPEIPRFNFEAQPIIDLKTISMELHELSGIEDNTQANEMAVKEELTSELNEPFSLSGINPDEDEDALIEENFLSGFEEVENESEADIVLSGADVVDIMDKGMLAEVHKARLSLIQDQKAGGILSTTIDIENELELMDEVIDAWQDEDDKRETLEVASQESKAFGNFFKALLFSLDELEQEQLNGLIEDDEEIFLARVDLSEMIEDEGDELDGLGLFRRKSKKNPKRKGRLKNILKKVGSTVKKGVRAVVRYNPATAAMRTAILGVLKINAFGMASKLIYGYMSEDQARRENLDLEEWRKMVDVRKKAEELYFKVGGKREKFKNAIANGRAKKKTNVQLSGGLGAVAAAGAAVTATPFLAKVGGFLKKLNPVKLFKGAKEKIASFKANRKAKKAAKEQEALQTQTETSPTDMSSQSGVPAQQDNNTANNTPENEGFMAKLKRNTQNLWTNHKKKIIVGSLVVLAIILFIIGYNKWKSKKKRQMAGIKAAKTRAKNRALQLKGTSTRKSTTKRKTLGRGNTTIVKTPSRGRGKTRVSRQSSGERLSLMHAKAKQLQKKHPNTKYSTLLSKASKMV